VAKDYRGESGLHVTWFDGPPGRGRCLQINDGPNPIWLGTRREQREGARESARHPPAGRAGDYVQLDERQWRELGGLILGALEQLAVDRASSAQRLLLQVIATKKAPGA